MDYKTRKELSSIEKIYWYLRFLVETDKGGLHKQKDVLNELHNTLGASLSSSKAFSESDQIEVLKQITTSTILKKSNPKSKKYAQLTALSVALTELFDSTDDVRALVFCLSKILIPSSEALDKVPTTDASDIAESYAKGVLDVKGVEGLANILQEWDSITLDICLNRERDIASKLFYDVKNELIHVEDLKRSYEPHASGPEADDIILSALMQEFERRLGQKRKQRSGQDLEDATSFILNYYDIPSAQTPEHFTAAIEVDNWTKDKKGWYIGFSLKRTLRERWKQTVVDKDQLTQFKIRYIIHLICNESDLTDNKIADMGSMRHLFFVADSSPILDRVKNDNVLADYVKPMSSLIEFLRTI